MKSFANQRAWLIVISDCHDSFNLTLTFLDCILHSIILFLHSSDELLIVLFFLNDRTVASFVDIIFDLNPILFIFLLEIKSERRFLLLE